MDLSNKEIGKVLIVDDNKTNTVILQKKLKDINIDSDVCHSGQEALDKVKQELPSMILLDVVMPELSGLDVLKELRKQHQSLELPVIMVTAKDEADDVVHALELGASDYITKPIQIKVLEARIKTQASLKNLYQKSINQKQLEAVHSLVITYNHEINNPLSVAQGMLWKAQNSNDLEPLTKVKESLDRIAEITKKIKKLSESDAVETEEYTSKSKMLKL